MPSMEKIVISGSLSVTTRTACPHTVCPPRDVDNANWKSAQAFSTDMNCLAQCRRHQSSKRRAGCDPSDAPIRFKAVIVAIVNALKMRQVEDLAKSSAAEVKRCNVSVLSRHTFNISLVHPPGPGDEPDGASLKHVANNFAFRFTSAIGT